ncbi:uncharacterized protein [Amphiura filiformis]|uniref:uncharacterized protein isoform X5 n=1 Tax=Amphiura filiformis TaxID=82378 RepID=UPI003B22286E
MEDYKHIIEARGNSAESRWQKEQAWESIAIRYNACSGIENMRDRTQLAILWKNLKARCKHEMATAVAPDSIAPPADPIGQKVASLVQRGKSQSEEVEASKGFGILRGVGIKIELESNGYENEDNQREDGSVDLPSNIDTDQSTASPSTARQDTEDNSETSRSAVDLTQQTSDSRKRKRTTPDRLIIDSSVDTSHKDDNLGTNSSGSEPTDDPEYYPKGVVVVQPTAVEDELESAPLAIREEPVVSRNEAAPTSNQRVLFAINRNPKKTPIPILPKITAVHSGYIPTAVNVAHVSQPRHSSTPYDRPQNRQRHTRAPPPPPPPPQQSGGFDPTVLQEQQQQEEHEAKMELFRLQIELATAQLRMAEDEHRIRFAKLQVELQTAQMEHDAKAAQLSTASSS